MVLFRTSYSDPPWPEKGGGKIKRGADKHYPVMDRYAILETIILAEPWVRLAPGAHHHYMWVTNNYLPDGLWLMDALGFRYVTNLVWAKDRIGLGQYFRGQHELLLFGVRGSGYDVRTERKDLGTLLEGPRTQHSKKPESAYERIEARSQGPYLELFARSGRPGWEAWGNEAPTQEEVPHGA